MRAGTFGDLLPCLRHASGWRAGSLAAAGLATAAMLLLADAGAAFASPIKFSIETLQDGSCGAACPKVITAEGDIDDTAPERYLEFLRSHINDKQVRNVVFLHSPGGAVTSAIKLGQYVRLMGSAVVIGRRERDGASEHFLPARCMSACVFVLMGGKKRVVPEYSLVGIHRMFREETGPDPSGERNRRREKLFASGNMVDAVSRYTSAMGISKDLIKAAEKVSPDQIHIITPDELARWRLGKGQF